MSETSVAAYVELYVGDGFRHKRLAQATARPGRWCAPGGVGVSEGGFDKLSPNGGEGFDRLSPNGCVAQPERGWAQPERNKPVRPELVEGPVTKPPFALSPSKCAHPHPPPIKHTPLHPTPN